MPMKKLKPAEANDGSYAGRVLAAFDTLRACRVCGCTQDHACQGGCWWTEDDLCSACDPRVSPSVGDRVTVAGETREVEVRKADRVIYSWPGKLAMRTLRIAAWQEWAMQAESYTAATS